MANSSGTPGDQLRGIVQRAPQPCGRIVVARGARQAVDDRTPRIGEHVLAQADAVRRRVGDLAYRNTLADLRSRADALRPLLAAHGIGLREDVLADPRRSILDGLPRASRDNDATARLRRALDDAAQLIARRS